MPLASRERLDGATLSLRGIPIGELGSFTPRQVALLAVAGDLPSASVHRAFEAELAGGRAAMRELSDALAALDACELEAVEAAEPDRRVLVAELIRCYFAMSLATPGLDGASEELDPAQEMARAADWLARAAGSSAQAALVAARDAADCRGRVPGFGHPRMRGVDPRFVALHAIVSRHGAGHALVATMQWAIGRVPGLEHEHEHEHEHECEAPWANLFLAMGVGMLLAGLDPRAHGARFAAEIADASAAVERACADRRS